MHEYWIGEGVDYGAIWSAYEAGDGYVEKFNSMRVHLFRMTLRQQPAELPLFNFEAVFKTVKGYFHDLKENCLSKEEYRTAGPLFIYDVRRGSGIWNFLGELRQLLVLGTTLADEKIMGQRIGNIQKRIDLLNRNFGSVASLEDYERFMNANTPRQLEDAVRKLLDQGIERIQISTQPFTGSVEAIEPSLVDIHGLIEEADQ